MDDSQPPVRHLPAYYQSGLDEAAMMQLLALQLAKQTPQVPQGQMVSGYYIKPSNLQYLANTAGNVQANRQMTEAQALRHRVMQQYLADSQRERQRIVGMTQPREQQLAGPPAEGETMGTELKQPDLRAAQGAAEASQFPEAQALAKSIQERRMKMFEEAAKTAGTQSVIDAAGSDDVTKLRPTEWSPLEVQKNEAGVFGVSKSTRGGQNIQGIQKSPEGPLDTFDRKMWADRVEDLRKGRADAVTLAKIQPTIYDAYRLLESGVLNTGAYASQLTEIQNFANKLGIRREDIPNNVGATQYFQGTLVPLLSQTLKDVRGVGSQSNAELQVALTRALDVNRDPGAIKAMLVHALRGAQLGLNEYNSMVNKTTSITPKGVNPAYSSDMKVDWSIPGMGEKEAKLFFPELFGGQFNPMTFFGGAPPPGGEPPPGPRVNPPRVMR